MAQFRHFAKTAGVMGENQNGAHFDELDAKFGPGGESDVAKAKAEWIARGYLEKNFTMAKMARLWEEDDRNAMQYANDMGVSRLAEKDDIMRLQEERSLGNRISKAVKQNNERIAKETSAWWKKTWTVLKDTLTPDAVKQQQEYKEYQNMVASQQAELKASDEVKEKVFSKIRATEAERQRISQARRVRLRKKRPDDIARRKALKAYNDKVAASRKKKEIAARRDRLRRQRAEREEQEIAALAIEDTQARRQQAIQHWSKVAEEQSVEAQLYTAKLTAEREARMQQDIQDNLDEMKRHDEELHNQQFPTVRVSDDAPSNGIFGVPMTRGEFANPEFDRDDEPGAMEVQLSVGVTQGVDYHEDLSKLMELQSELQRTKEEHSVLQGKIDANNEKIRMNEELGMALSNEMEDIERTEAAYKRSLIGPPGRQPSEKDKMASHHRKRRKFDLHRQQLAMEREIRQRNENSAQIAIHKSKLEKHLRALSMRTQEQEHKMKLEDQLRPELPMIVGKAINVPPFMRSPAKSLGAVRLETKIAIAKESSDGIFDVYRQSKRAAHAQWLLKQKQQAVSDAVIRTVAKKRDVEHRLASLVASDNRQRIVTAIDKFFSAGGLKLLRPPQGRGQIPLVWFKWRQKSRSCVVWSGTSENPSKAGGVTLADVDTIATSQLSDTHLKAAIDIQKIARRFLVRCGIKKRAAEFVRTRVQAAKEELKTMVASIDIDIIEEQAKLAWAWDHDEVHRVNIDRHTAMDSLGVTVVLPKQIDLVFHELELRVSEAFVLVESFSSTASLLADAGIEVGDAILSVNGDRFDTVAQFAMLCRRVQKIELEFVRLADIPVDESYVKGIKRAIIKRILRSVKKEAAHVASLGTGNSLKAGEPHRHKYGVYSSESDVEVHFDGIPHAQQRPTTVGSLRDFFKVDVRAAHDKAESDTGAKSSARSRDRSRKQRNKQQSSSTRSKPSRRAGSQDESMRSASAGNMQAFIEGSLPLPSFGVWEVTFQIQKVDMRDMSSGDPNDFVSVRFGTSLETLSLVGTFFNVPPDGGGKTICHKVDHKHVGRRLAYRIDFSRNIATALSEKQQSGADGRLQISNAAVKLHEPDPLFEYTVTSGKAKGETRCVSAYVQRLRLQSNQKSQRAIELFLEQERIRKILLENPAIEQLDSMLIHGSHQRFPRDELIRQLQEEVDKEQARAMAKVAQIQAMRAKLATAKANELSSEEKLERKLMKSKKRYIHRRRRQRPVIDEDAAHDMVGKTCEFFHPESERWVFGIVRACKKIWLDMGTHCQIVHKIEFLKEFDPKDEPTEWRVTDVAQGGTQPPQPTPTQQLTEKNCEWFDLNEQLYTILSSGFSSIFAARVARDRLLYNRKRNRRRRADAFEKRQAVKRKEELEELQSKEAEMEKIIASELERTEQTAKEEARTRIDDLEEVQAQITQVKMKLQLDEKMGVNEDRQQRILAEDEAVERAEALYVQKFTEYKLLKCRQQCRVKRKAFKQYRRRQLAQWAKDAQQRAELFDLAQRFVLNLESNDATFLFTPIDPVPALEAHLASTGVVDKHQRSSAVKLLTSPAAKKALVVEVKPLSSEEKMKLNIANFEKAAYPKQGCEHPLLKYWKTKYKSGYRCRTCGKELSHTHDDPDQVEGRGIVPEEPMNPFEEFVMLRKEDGLIQMNESTFYDYDISRHMYKLNYLHELNGQTKTSGNALAIAAEEARVAANREKALAQLGGRDKFALTAAELEDKPSFEEIQRNKPYDLSLRLSRQQHIMRNKDMLTMFFRVGKYREAIAAMKKAQLAARGEMKELSHRVSSLHRELVLGEKISARVGADHARADRLIARREAARKQVQHCQKVLDDLRGVRAKLQKKWTERDEEVGKAKKNYGNLLQQVESLLRLLRQSKRQRDESAAKIKLLQGRLQIAATQLKKSDQVLLKQYYTQQGRLVRTKFGFARVISYEASTDMLKLQLLWNSNWSSKFTSKESSLSSSTQASDSDKLSKPFVATIQMVAGVVMGTERARQREELRLMRQEDQRMRTVNSFDRRRRQLEVCAMNACEHYNLQLRDVSSLIEQEEENVAKALAVIADDCRYLFDHKEDDEASVQAYKPIADEIDRRVAEEVLKVKDAILDYERNGGPKKPKPMSARQINELRAKYKIDVEAQYVEGRSVTAERDIRLAYAKLRSEDAEQRALDSIFRDLLQDVMRSSLASILENSAKARQRAEDSSGLSFTVPAVGPLGLPYKKWRDMSMQWNAHKWYRESLLASLGAENMVEMQARQARDQEAMLKRMRQEWVDKRGLPEADFSVEALQAIWAREEDEAEQRAMNESRERKRMAVNEKETREFNARELKIRLDTRRSMAKEEAYMRKLMAHERVLAGDDEVEEPQKRKKKRSRGRGTKSKRRWDKVGQMVAVATMTSSKLARRAFLKERHVERMKQKREWPLMEAEDVFGFHLRADTLRMEAEKKAKIAAALASGMGGGGGAEAQVVEGDDSSLTAMMQALSSGQLKVDFSNPAFVKHLKMLESAEWSESSDEEWLSGSDYEWETDDEAQHEKEQHLVRASRKIRRRQRHERRRQRELERSSALANITGADADHTANSQKDQEKRLKKELRQKHRLERKQRAVQRRKVIPATISRRFLTALVNAAPDHDVLSLGVPSASADSSGLLPPAPVAVKPVEPHLLHIFWFRDLYPALLQAPITRRTLMRQMDRLQLAPKKKAMHLRKLDDASEAMRLAVCNVVGMQLEIARMKEDITAEKRRHSDLAHNTFKIGIKSRAKGYRELTLRRALERARSALEDADEELEACREDVLDAEEDLADAQHELEIATNDTVYFDTAFIHGAMQRYKFDDIYPKLKSLSFQKLVEIIVVRAEVCACERRLRDVSGFLQQNAVKIASKQKDLLHLQRNTRRRERMCTKRSHLCKQGFFPKARKITLATAFGGWVSLISFKANIHRAFDLRFALLKQEQEIKLYKKEQGLQPKQKKHPGSSVGSGLGDREAVLELDPPDPFNAQQRPKFIRSHMHAHVSHRVRCKFCNRWFMEAQNHEEACRYHPGKYVMSCPTSCPYFKEGKPAYSCRAHYRWRWSCCGEDKDEPFMANGCQQRFHVAGKDELYENIVEEEKERQKIRAAEENERERVLDGMLNDVRGRGGRMLRKAEATMTEKRSHLGVYHSFKDNGAGGGMYAAQKIMDEQNKSRLKQLFGPPPEMHFAVDRANNEREIQKALDAGEVHSEFAMRRRKLVHPDSDDDLD